MITIVAAASLVGCALWFLFPVRAVAFHRRPRNDVGASPAGGSSPGDVEVFDDTGAPAWTALDEHQLTRLLKDSAPRP